MGEHEIAKAMLAFIGETPSAVSAGKV
jgi:hypothetical protein